MRDASLERTSYGSLLDSPAFGALRDRGTTRRPTIPRQGSGRRVSSRLSVTRTVTVEGHPLPNRTDQVSNLRLSPAACAPWLGDPKTGPRVAFRRSVRPSSRIRDVEKLGLRRGAFPI